MSHKKNQGPPYFDSSRIKTNPISKNPEEVNLKLNNDGKFEIEKNYVAIPISDINRMKEVYERLLKHLFDDLEGRVKTQKFVEFDYLTSALYHITHRRYIKLSPDEIKN